MRRAQVMRYLSSRVWQISLLLIAAILSAGGTVAAPASNQGQTAGGRLRNKMIAMRKLHTWRAEFVCEKHLSVLRQPFISSGILAIARPDKVRFATRKPYRSSVILTGNNIYLRSQTNHRWHKADPSRSKSLGYIMGQLAQWSLGHVHRLGKDYRISCAIAALPIRPATGPPRHRSHKVAVMRTLFTLVPRRGILAKAIRNLQLGFARHSSRLVYIAIHQVTGDATLYWLYKQEMNPPIRPNYFKPTGSP